MFADGTKFYADIRNDKDGESLQKDITKLEEWAENSRSGSMPTKCKVMHIVKYNLKYSYSMKQDL